MMIGELFSWTTKVKREVDEKCLDGLFFVSNTGMKEQIRTEMDEMGLLVHDGIEREPSLDGYPWTLSECTSTGKIFAFAKDPGLGRLKIVGVFATPGSNSAMA